MKLYLLLFPALLLLNKNCSTTTAGSASTNDKSSEQPQNNINASVQNIINDTSDNAIHFGVMVAKTNGQQIPPERQVVVAKALGVNYIRARIDIKAWAGFNPAYDVYAGAGFKIILNINYGIPRDLTGEKDPVPFPTDMASYSKTITSILAKYKPEVVVIENEEDNPGYHSGDADDYINELKTGIQIAHSKGLKVTNGGITVREVCLIVYDDYMQHGETQKAKEFAQRAFPGIYLQRLNNMDNPLVKRQLEFGRKIIAAYKTLDLDYINFHWYEPVRARGAAGISLSDSDFNPQTFLEVASYLKKVTGKPVMNNEFGVFTSSAELVKKLLQTVNDAGLAYAIFYSADGGTGKAVALQNAGGDLRENGIAFRDFIKQHK